MTSSEQQKEQLVLVDGSGYIFRAFHGLPMMNRADGTPINAVFGFTKMLMKLSSDLQPSHIAVIFDAGRRTFRNDIYPDYKANRSEPPDELVPQFALVRDATNALGLPAIEMAGFEADDIIASYARLATEAQMDCVIISSDKDLMQLVNPHVSMLDPMKQRPIGADEVVEKFGVTPDRVIDVQALAGDSTDNVPGVPGIGVKTAAELINQFGDLDTLLAQAETIKQPKRRENLVSFAEQARISRQLVRLKNDVELPLTIDQLASQPRDVDVLVGFLRAQGFNSLLLALGDAGTAPPAPTTDAKVQRSAHTKDQPADQPAPIMPPQVEQTDYQLVTSTQALSGWIDEATAQGFVAVDTETSSLNAAEAELVGISLATAPGRACYIPLRHSHPDSAPADGFDFLSADSEAAPTPEQIPFETAMAMLATLFHNPSVLKIGHNLKYDSHVLSYPDNGGITLTPIDDTMCLSYVLDAGRTERHGLDSLAMNMLGHQTIKYEDVCGKGAKQIPFGHVAIEAACDYAAEDADICLRLWMMLKPRLAQEGMAAVYERLERPLISVLAGMEQQGISLDVGFLNRLSNEFALRIAALETEIHAAAGESFNIASPKQLGDILFNKLGYPAPKKSKTGAYSTGADILEDLAATGVEIAKLVLDYRQLAKLKSTYTDALSASLNQKTKRVHTSFSMVGASTGRLSSSEPNLQNIPIRTQEGRQIRNAFIAKEGHQLISADYSQIELRLVAHVAKEASMLEAFRNGVDIHAQTASEVFGIPLDAMDGETRRRAKAINFGIIYGISAFGLARQLSIGRAEAGQYIGAYFEKFPGIQAYMDEAKQFAKDNQFVKTLFGRKIHIQQIASSNGAVRAFAERQAINAPIQGSAADIIKRAMIRLPDALAAEKLDAEMLLQVHDELIFEVPDEQADRAKDVIIGVMQSAHQPVLDLSVPLIVEAGMATSWAEAH